MGKGGRKKVKRTSQAPDDIAGELTRLFRHNVGVEFNIDDLWSLLPFKAKDQAEFRRQKQRIRNHLVKLRREGLIIATGRGRNVKYVKPLPPKKRVRTPKVWGREWNPPRSGSLISPPSLRKRVDAMKNGMAAQAGELFGEAIKALMETQETRVSLDVCKVGDDLMVRVVDETEGEGVQLSLRTFKVDEPKKAKAK